MVAVFVDCGVFSELDFENAVDLTAGMLCPHTDVSYSMTWREKGRVKKRKEKPWQMVRPYNR